MNRLTLLFALLIPSVILAQGTPPSTPYLGTIGNNGNAAVQGSYSLPTSIVGGSYTLGPNEWWPAQLVLPSGISLTSNLTIIAPANAGQFYNSICNHATLNSYTVSFEVSGQATPVSVPTSTQSTGCTLVNYDPILSAYVAGGSSGAVASVTPGTNVTCTPLMSGSCTGAVTINATGGGGSAGNTSEFVTGNSGVVAAIPDDIFHSTLDMEGDSITCGVGADGSAGCGNPDGYAYLLADAMGFSGTNASNYLNHGASGSATCTQGVYNIFGHTSPDITGSTLYTYMLSTNDWLNGEDIPTFTACQKAAVSWLASPSNYKTTGAYFSSSLPANWTLDNTYPVSGSAPGIPFVGIQTTTNGASSVWPISTHGGTVAIWYQMVNGSGGTATISVDSGQTANFTTAPPGTIVQTTYAPGVVFISGVPAGNHTVTITVTSATGSGNDVHVYAVGTIDTYASRSMVYVGGTPFQDAASPISGGDALIAAFNTAIQANVLALGELGFNVHFVNVQSCMFGSAAEMFNSLHPNNLGHLELFHCFYGAIRPVAQNPLQFATQYSGLEILNAGIRYPNPYTATVTDTFILANGNNVILPTTQTVGKIYTVANYFGAATITVTVNGSPVYLAASQAQSWISWNGSELLPVGSYQNLGPLFGQGIFNVANTGSASTYTPTTSDVVIFTNGSPNVTLPSTVVNGKIYIVPNYTGASSITVSGSSYGTETIAGGSSEIFLGVVGQWISLGVNKGLSVTTYGISGPSTLTGGVLNIPNYNQGVPVTTASAGGTYAATASDRYILSNGGTNVSLPATQTIGKLYTVFNYYPAAITVTLLHDSSFITLLQGQSQTWVSYDGSQLFSLGYAPLVSPNFTGSPTAPTAAVGTNSTQIATTAYVLAAIPGAITPSTATATPATNVTSATCATATCTNLRGTYNTITAGAYTGGLLVTLSWAATPTAYVCTVTGQGGAAVTNSVATTTGMTISTSVTSDGDPTIDYSCQP
jgi:hypothetical protein